jgi:hypothetical protein
MAAPQGQHAAKFGEITSQHSFSITVSQNAAARRVSTGAPEFKIFAPRAHLNEMSPLRGAKIRCKKSPLGALGDIGIQRRA